MKPIRSAMMDALDTAQYGRLRLTIDLVVGDQWADLDVICSRVATAYLDEGRVPPRRDDVRRALRDMCKDKMLKRNMLGFFLETQWRQAPPTGDLGKQTRLL